MTNPNETASILNFSIRSLFMIIDNPCTNNCTSFINSTNNIRSDKIFNDPEQREQQYLLDEAARNCSSAIQKLSNGKLFFSKKKILFPFDTFIFISFSLQNRSDQISSYRCFLKYNF